MKVLLDKKYTNTYFVTAVIAAFLIFMVVSAMVVMENIGGGKTSADVALDQAKKKCDKRNGELIQLNKNNPLNTACVVNGGSTQPDN